MPDHTDPLTGQIAVVGMAGRFPGASSVPELWELLRLGREAVRRFSAEEMAAAGVSPADVGAPTRVPYGADLAGADRFDADFFGVTPRDARLMDPQHRVLLTCAWEAAEDAGLVTGGGANVAVYAAGSLSTYLLFHVLRSAEHADGALTYPVLLGNDKDFLATRVAYKLGLRGPAMTVQTACSSSLTAVHLACRALNDGEVDAALAGGVSISFPQTAGYDYQEGGILSRDGHCRVFDAESSGTVKGNGCGVVVLKRLADARRDGDRVYAVIRGSALNNDGSAKIGFTAPGTAGQQAVIRRAIEVSGVPVGDIGYIETHGTGTAVGDPLELNSLAAAHRAEGTPAEGTLIGSLKANLGHLDAAAGVTGLIKAALVLHHQTVPPQINIGEPNPYLGLDRLPYEVPRAEVRFDAQPLRAAAVSSFGIGGTNAHCVLAQAPSAPPAHQDHPATPYPIVLSARDAGALTDLALLLRAHLDEHPRIRLADLAHTLFAGRTRQPVVHTFTAADLTDVRAGLDGLIADGANGQLPPGDTPLPLARKISLPGHPLRPQRHWIEPDTPRPVRRQPATEQAPGAPVPVPVTTAAETGTDDGVLEQVTAVLEEHLGIRGITPDDDYHDLGGDSLLAVEIVSVLRSRLGVTLELDAFGTLRTPRRMAEAVRATRAGETTGRALVTVREGEGAPLFLVHPAGGTNLLYVKLAQHSHSTLPLTALSFPAPTGGGRPRTLRELAALYVERVRSAQPHGPYRLGGYSFGGNVAFEMAVQLQAAGEQVEPVLMLDTHVPESYVGGRLSPGEFDAAFDVLSEQTSLMRGADLDILREEGFLTIWQANHDMLKAYYPDRRFDGDVLLLQAEECEPEELLDALRINVRDKSLWQDHITGRLRVQKVPGHHFTMFEDGERITALAAAFDDAVTRYRER
ncbi:beta-ketoacyl synthase N-terminal-like domain-containing protein [Streptomyces sp. NBC_00151]|uniref:beta-ketoacyl synthase N-terminal-like domain-containing protein n=1 Tax=Streptomyces sp. NBC_00151 TaxID=2975669 RepID=UPI002DD87D0E|nr:beta-ketoacyl synthase N-terminal-like domain-containing protein [Streptomyces sp. NBC_00151]WRZ36840.1 thioesterase domain-containing protein [Streptomyces sp. NBC_00151]WRZ44737.1 thioesterase domain-containing protein [Streptomyces sp. NBC_00151]